VSDTLAYFEGVGRESSARIGDWSALDVLVHFTYWHYATAWGMYSASIGGPPWQLSAPADETNAACLLLLKGDGFPEMIAQLRRLQSRLVLAATAAPDLDAPALRMPDGRDVSVGQRLEIMARHWRSHLEALQAG
jgi:hypothetical protein